MVSLSILTVDGKKGKISLNSKDDAKAIIEEIRNRLRVASPLNGSYAIADDFYEVQPGFWIRVGAIVAIQIIEDDKPKAKQ